MGKLDIAMKVTSAGSSTPVAVTGGDWIAKVVDLRDALKEIKPDEDKTIRLLSFAPNGALLTLARRLSGRDGDNVSLWLYIPNDIDIDGYEIDDIAKKMESVLWQTRITVEDMESIIDADFPTLASPATCKPSPRDGAYAYRTDCSDLSEALGPNRCQPYYDPFRFIFLIDNPDMLASDSMTDLTGQPFEKAEPKEEDNETEPEMKQPDNKLKHMGIGFALGVAATLAVCALCGAFSHSHESTGNAMAPADSTALGALPSDSIVADSLNLDTISQ